MLHADLKDDLVNIDGGRRESFGWQPRTSKTPIDWSCGGIDRGGSAANSAQTRWKGISQFICFCLD